MTTIDRVFINIELKRLFIISKMLFLYTETQKNHTLAFLLKDDSDMYTSVRNLKLFFLQQKFEDD